MKLFLPPAPRAAPDPEPGGVWAKMMLDTVLCGGLMLAFMAAGQQQQQGGGIVLRRKSDTPVAKAAPSRRRPSAGAVAGMAVGGVAGFGAGAALAGYFICRRISLRACGAQAARREACPGQGGGEGSVGEQTEEAARQEEAQGPRKKSDDQRQLQEYREKFEAKIQCCSKILAAIKKLEKLADPGRFNPQDALDIMKDGHDKDRSHFAKALEALQEIKECMEALGENEATKEFEDMMQPLINEWETVDFPGEKSMQSAKFSQFRMFDTMDAFTA